MSDTCGCGGDEADVSGQSEEQSRIPVGGRELQFAAVAGVFLLAGLIAGGAGAPPTVVLTLEAVALVVGAYTFVPSTLKRLAKGRIGVGTLMTIAAVGAVLLGEVGEAAMLAFLFSISEGLEEYSLARTRRGLRALLSLVPDQATVLRDDTETGRVLKRIACRRPNAGQARRADRHRRHHPRRSHRAGCLGHHR